MSINQPGLPPAGWFPDPTGAPLQRWWDGQSWTAHERAVEAPLVAPSAPALAPVPSLPEPVSAPDYTTAQQHLAQPVEPAQPVLPTIPVYPTAAPAASIPAATIPAATPAVATTPAYVPSAPAQSVASVPQPELAHETARVAPQQQYAAQPAQPVQQPVPVQPAVVPQPVRQQAAVSSFAPETPAAPMFPAPVSAISVQSPTTAAFDFRFSSPDDLGVNGRSPAFQAAAVAAAAGVTAAAPPAPSPEAAPYAPLRSERRAQAPSRESGPKGWSTGSVWVLVLLPLLRAAFAAAAFYALVNLDVGYISAAAIAVAPYVIGVLLAVSDRKRLVGKGFERPASWAWSLFGEWLYLILRAVATRREVAGGSIVVLLWVLVLALVGAGGYYYLSTTDLPVIELILG